MKRLVTALALAMTTTCTAVCATARADGPIQIDDKGWHWQDDEGRTVAFSDYAGQPVILAMFSTDCPSRCPKTVAKLRAIEASYARAGKPVQIVLVSLDPDHDTPERLRAYKLEAKLSDRTWHLLTGSREQARDLASRLNLHPIYDGSRVDHAVRTFVFDATEKWVKTLYGWHFAEAEALIP